jgi:hypothetical protein
MIWFFSFFMLLFNCLGSIRAFNDG